MKNIIVFGFSPLFIKAVKDLKDIQFFIVEEQELFKLNDYDLQTPEKFPNIKQIIFTEYMNASDYEETLLHLNQQYPIDAVIPVREYCVLAASRMSELLNLPGIGESNAKILTNKIKLREACSKYNIPHPRYKKVQTKSDLVDFYQGKPIIFKPANRQASLGISKISSSNDIDIAWGYTTCAEEGKGAIVKRNFTPEYIAEDFIEGFEVSVETFVQNGEIKFINITQKISDEIHFVEQGHIVPAQLNPIVKENIEQAKAHFVKQLNIQNGLLHSEWKICGEQPILIECAARFPGDGITDLIGNTYGFNFYEMICNIYLGKQVDIPNKVQYISTSRYLSGPSGKIKSIKGIDYLKNADHIIRWYLKFQEGDEINAISSSWDRLGYFITYDDSYEKLENRVNDLMEHIIFEV